MILKCASEACPKNRTAPPTGTRNPRNEELEWLARNPSDKHLAVRCLQQQRRHDKHARTWMFHETALNLRSQRSPRLHRKARQIQLCELLSPPRPELGTSGRRGTSGKSVQPLLISAVLLDQLSKRRRWLHSRADQGQKPGVHGGPRKLGASRRLVSAQRLRSAGKRGSVQRRATGSQPRRRGPARGERAAALDRRKLCTKYGPRSTTAPPSEAPPLGGGPWSTFCAPRSPIKGGCVYRAGLVGPLSARVAFVGILPAGN